MLSSHRERSWEEQIKEMVIACDKRMAAWRRYTKGFSTEQHSVPMQLMQAIRHYLIAYLEKNHDNKFDLLLEEGYLKYKKHEMISDYIPRLALCKIDALKEKDLKCAKEIINQSLWLSNDEFLKNAQAILSPVTLLQVEFDRIDMEYDIRYKKTLSNGFKYYTTGVLLEQERNWQKNFSSYQVPKKVNQGISALHFLVAGIGAALMSRGDYERGLIVLVCACLLYQISDRFSDHLAVAFFKSKTQAPQEDTKAPEKKFQHVSFYRIGHIVKNN